MLKLTPAYMAGYTDAEGCISITQQKYKAPSVWFARVSFRQAFPVIVRAMHARFGGSMSLERAPNRKPIHILRWQALEEVRTYLQVVLPFLREKHAQAQAVLGFDTRAGDEVNLKLQAFLTEEKKLEVDRSMTHKAPRQEGPCARCTNKAFSRGLCANHYQQARVKGEIERLEKPARLRQPTDNERAYAAGYFDGDGSITMRKHSDGYRYPVASFGQTRPEAVTLLYQIYGGSLTFRPAITEDRRPRLLWQLAQHSAVRAFLDDISEFSIEKHSEVETARTWCRAENEKASLL